MAEPRQHLSHLLVENRSTDEEFRRRGGGDPKIRPVESRAGHGGGRLGETRTALDAADQARAELLTEEELRALGTVITLEGTNAEYPLAIDRLERMSTHRKTPKRPQWLLLSVLPAQPDLELPERAMVWVSDDYRAQFLKLFEDYLELSSSAGTRGTTSSWRTSPGSVKACSPTSGNPMDSSADREALVGGLATGDG